MNHRQTETTTKVEAVLFDMDGLLIDSEPFWRESETAVFATVGIALTDEMCRQTTGLRVDDVVEHWHRERPWDGVPKRKVELRIVDECVRLIRLRGEPLPAVRETIGLVGERGLRAALVSSSPTRMIEAVVARLDLGGAFELVHSAEEEEFGKPHPAVYIHAARKLGVRPAACLAIEDSLAGVIAAKAARMRCVAVPEPGARRDPRFSIADAVFDSLAELTPEALSALGA
jgi:mannitol-1-/sugar-/sorbitol-6-/2-deoxyglucose-6-phosphatase